ncbi:MAG: hypothetical protein HZA78_04305 [Candidatus Schekmanbacteria bacterium]|nr:hypothetical protein [Candidatus Schekmanbacteria bacterium]
MQKIPDKFRRTVFGFPLWQILIVTFAGAGAGYSYKYHQVTYIYPFAWQTYPFTLILPNMIIGSLLALSLWIGYGLFLFWSTSRPLSGLLRYDCFSFIPFILLLLVPALPESLPESIVIVFLLWKVLFFIPFLPYRKIKEHKITVAAVSGLILFSAFFWHKTAYLGLSSSRYMSLSLGRGIAAHVPIKVAQLAKYFQYPAWNPEMYSGGWAYIYSQVYGYIGYWLLGFFPVSPVLFQQFVLFETFLPLYFMMIFSCVGFYFFLKKSLQLAQFTAFFGGMFYLMNFFTRAIIHDETNQFFAYLVFPWVFLLAERSLKKQNLFFAALSGILLNFLVPSIYAHAETFYTFYFILGAFYLSASACYYENKSWFPVKALLVCGLAHLCFANYYFPIFEFSSAFKEAVNLAQETDRMTRGFGPYIPLFYPFYIGVIPGLLIVYGFVRIKAVTAKKFSAPGFITRFSFITFIVLSLVQLGRELPVYSIFAVPVKYMFPFVHFWLRFAPGLFFFHYIIACLGLEALLTELDSPEKIVSGDYQPGCIIRQFIESKTFRVAGRMFLVCILYVAIVVIGRQLYISAKGLPNKNLFVMPIHEVINRDHKYFWPYLAVGFVAVLCLLIFKNRSLRNVCFFLAAFLPVVHYLGQIGDNPGKGIMDGFTDRSIYDNDNRLALAYVERNPRDTTALEAFNCFTAAQATPLLPDGIQDLKLRPDKKFNAKVNFMKEHLFPSYNSFLKPYLLERGFSRFLEIGQATPAFTFYCHNFPYANCIFNLGGNIGRAHHWRWLPQFDYYFPWHECNDCTWYMEPETAIERLWTLNLMGVKHLIISENDYQAIKQQTPPDKQQKSPENFLLNPSFESWSSGKDSLPDGWKLEGSGGVKQSNGAKNGSFSAELIRKGEYGKLTQNVWERAGGEAVRGKNYTFASWVKTSSRNVQLMIRDYYGDVRSEFHSGSGLWEFLSVTKTIHPQATVLEVSYHLMGDGAAQFDGAVFGMFQDLAVIKTENFLENRGKFLKLPVEGITAGADPNKDPKVVQLRNDSALPLMFLVDNYKYIFPEAGKDEKWQVMKSIDYKNTVLLEEKPLPTQAKSKFGQWEKVVQDPVDIIDIRGNIAAANVHVQSPYSFLFYSDNYHPDWIALIDGKPGKVYRADLAFKVVVIEKGKHLLWLEFRPKSLWLGLYLAATTLLVIMAATARYYLLAAVAPDNGGLIKNG